MSTIESRLRELKQSAEALHMAANANDPRAIERAVGRIYATAGHMAEHQEISWTNVCECACKEHDKPEEEE